MASPNTHLAWYNISPSMLLSLCHHITSKAEALNQDSNKENKSCYHQEIVENTNNTTCLFTTSRSSILSIDHITSKCMYIVNAWLTSLTLQQLSIYGIMHEHVNACSWYQSKEIQDKTLILACERQSNN